MTCPARDTLRAKLELADVLRAHADSLGPLSPTRQRVVRAIVQCRTAALGGHVHECDHCGHREVSYNSCRNRHCPKCQSLHRARWVQARKADLLPVEYFHVVFTAPDDLHPFFQCHPRLGYDLLFAAVAETLQQVALHPKNLGATIGFTAILHTWTQTLLFHPHIHCIVPGGGLDPQGRWVSCKAGFFLPVRILSEVFRGKLLSRLEAALADGRLKLHQDARALLGRAASKSWVVYSKPPLAGPEQAIDYLGRYTYRIALSNERLVSLCDDRVTFRYRDRAHGDRPRLMTLGAAEFLRRFLQHVVPRSLVRIRHYGFLANAVRRQKIARCRELLGAPPQPAANPDAPHESWPALMLRLTGKDPTLCPHCRNGRLVVKESIPPAPPTPRGVSP